MAEVDARRDYAAFLSSANYPLVKHTDMTAEERDSAVDICIGAVGETQLGHGEVHTGEAWHRHRP